MRKKILLLGDSISMGYRSYVKNSLRNVNCDVVFPQENCKMAAHLYRMMYEWIQDLDLSENNVALVYWNAGLWDCVRIFGEECQTGLEIYKEYLLRIDKRIKKLFPNAKVCFALTTPVSEKKYSDEFYRLNSDIELYNDAAREVLQTAEDIDDLFGFVGDCQSADDIYSDATHFNDRFNNVIAKHVSDFICERIELEQENHYDIRLESQNNSSIIARDKNNVYLWGAGKRCTRYMEAFVEYGFVIKGLVDSDGRKWEKEFNGVICNSPEVFLGKHDDEYVIVTLDNPDAQEEIGLICIDNGIKFCIYTDILQYVMPIVEENRVLGTKFIDAVPHGQDKMMKYVGINVPAYGCNLNCSYCYLEQKAQGKDAFPKLIHSPKYIRYQLRREKIGGAALVGLCAFGETMLVDQFVDVCDELLREGHYLHIVTNGTCTSKIEELISKAGEYASHILFKLSFHYLELKNRGMLNRFVNSVKLIEKSDSSYTLELMPHDEIIGLIDEIKLFSMQNFQSLPQLTIGRDEHNGCRLLTSLEKNDYHKVWSSFGSLMFDTRMKLYMMHGVNCNAGRDSFDLDLQTGDVSRCIYYEDIDYFYGKDFKVNYERVGDSCPMDYCFNCHVYATLGMMPDIEVPTYYDIRDGVKENGAHWIKDEMRTFLDTKLFRNHGNSCS